MKAILDLLKAEAASLGFSFVHLTRPSPPAHYPQYLQWLARGFAADIRYLSSERVLHSRRDPSSLLNQACSIIVLGLLYSPQVDLNSSIEEEGAPKGYIAAYALHEDYHRVLKAKARQLMERLKPSFGRAVHYRIFVDSASLLEKDTACMAGAGWIGRHSLLITPENGSYQVLACILTDLDLPFDQPFSQDLCTNCRRCLQACPTACIQSDHSIDASRCIAYLTIEHQGVIPRELRSKIGQWVFGCDVCQRVCPYNQPSLISESDIEGLPLLGIQHPLDLLREIQLSPAAYEQKYQRSPVLRASFQSYRRNLIIAMGNSTNPACLPALQEILFNDPDEILRLHAAWAIGQLAHADSRCVLRASLNAEKHSTVRKEIEWSLLQLSGSMK